MDELGDNQICRLLVDLAAHEHDPVVEQPGVDVERALAASGLLHDHGNEWHGSSCWSAKVQPAGCRTSNLADAQQYGCEFIDRRRAVTDRIERELWLPATPEAVWEAVIGDGWLAERVRLD